MMIVITPLRRGFRMMIITDEVVVVIDIHRVDAGDKPGSVEDRVRPPLRWSGSAAPSQGDGAVYPARTCTIVQDIKHIRAKIVTKLR